MSRLYSGKILEASPQYREAVRRQQEKERLCAEKRPRILVQLPKILAGNKPTVETIIAMIARKHGLASGDLKRPRRMPSIVNARSDAIAEIYTCLPEISVLAIRRALGGCDHRTIQKALHIRSIKICEYARYGYRAQVLRLAAMGYGPAQIKTALGCSRSTVQRILRRERNGQLMQANPIDTGSV